MSNFSLTRGEQTGSLGEKIYPHVTGQFVENLLVEFLKRHNRAEKIHHHLGGNRMNVARVCYHHETPSIITSRQADRQPVGREA